MTYFQQSCDCEANSKPFLSMSSTHKRLTRLYLTGLADEDELFPELEVFWVETSGQMKQVKGSNISPHLFNHIF